MMLAAMLLAAVPHIAVILVDDLDVGTTWQMRLAGSLPAIDSLAVGGVRFDRAVVTNSVCAPSRATLMTGRYSHNTGVNCNSPTCADGSSGGVGAFDHSNTLATWLQAAGYRTGHFGKWINGYGDNAGAAPTSPRNPAYVPPGWTTWQALIDPTTYYSYGYRINVDGQAVQYGSTAADHQTRVVAGRAAAWIAVNRSAAPLFVLVAPVAPHFTGDFLIGPIEQGYSNTWDAAPLPDLRDATLHPSAWASSSSLPFWPSFKPTFNVPSPLVSLARPLMRSQDVAQAAAQYRLRALAMIAVDDAVAQVIAAFGTDPAWIIFTSDNGYQLGERALGNKMTAFNEAIRVPLFVRGPGVVAGSRAEIVTNNDLAPTIAELAGATPALTVDGRSLGPLLRGESVPWRTATLIEHRQIPAAVYDFPRYDAVHTDTRRLYVDWPETAECELYDGTSDPWQASNVCAARPVEVASLQARLVALKECAGAACSVAEGE